MVNRARRKCAASFLVLSLIISPAAFAAAAESSSQDKPQTEAEAKSYLPPWMQGKDGNENASAGAPAAAATPNNNATQGSKTTAASDNDAPKRKIRGASQGHRSHRHASPAIFRGFAGLFGQ